jgi:hypothetical protein
VDHVEVCELGQTLAGLLQHGIPEEAGSPHLGARLDLKDIMTHLDEILHDVTQQCGVAVEVQVVVVPQGLVLEEGPDLLGVLIVLGVASLVLEIVVEG